MREDNPQPIKHYHVSFARAVVALARQHGVGDVTMTFRRASSKIMRSEEYHWDATEVTMKWHEGRHGDVARVELHLQAEAKASFLEIEGTEP